MSVHEDSCLNSLYRNREIRRAFDITCYFCESTGKLHAHHIDLAGPHLSSTAKNTLGNLVMLCRRCHQRLHILLQPEKYTYIVKVKDKQRIDDIVNQHRQGITLVQIGAQYGLSRQRVLQILKANLSPEELRPVNAKDIPINGCAARLIQRRFNRPLRDVLAEYYAHYGTVAEVAKALNTTSGRVNYWMRVLDIPRHRTGRRSTRPAWPDALAS